MAIKNLLDVSLRNTLATYDLSLVDPPKASQGLVVGADAAELIQKAIGAAIAEGSIDPNDREAVTELYAQIMGIHSFAIEYTDAAEAAGGERPEATFYQQTWNAINPLGTPEMDKSWSAIVDIAAMPFSGIGDVNFANAVTTIQPVQATWLAIAILPEVKRLREEAEQLASTQSGKDKLGIGVVPTITRTDVTADTRKRIEQETGDWIAGWFYTYIPFLADIFYTIDIPAIEKEAEEALRASLAVKPRHADLETAKAYYVAEQLGEHMRGMEILPGIGEPTEAHISWVTGLAPGGKDFITDEPLFALAYPQEQRENVLNITRSEYHRLPTVAQQIADRLTESNLDPSALAMTVGGLSVAGGAAIWGASKVASPVVKLMTAPVRLPARAVASAIPSSALTRVAGRVALPLFIGYEVYNAGSTYIEFKRNIEQAALQESWPQEKLQYAYSVLNMATAISVGDDATFGGLGLFEFESSIEDADVRRVLFPADARLIGQNAGDSHIKTAYSWIDKHTDPNNASSSFHRLLDGDGLSMQRQELQREMLLRQAQAAPYAIGTTYFPTITSRYFAYREYEDTKVSSLIEPTPLFGPTAPFFNSSIFSNQHEPYIPTSMRSFDDFGVAATSLARYRDFAKVNPNDSNPYLTLGVDGQWQGNPYVLLVRERFEQTQGRAIATAPSITQADAERAFKKEVAEQLIPYILDFRHASASPTSAPREQERSREQIIRELRDIAAGKNNRDPLQIPDIDDFTNIPGITPFADTERFTSIPTISARLEQAQRDRAQYEITIQQAFLGYLSSSDGQQGLLPDLEEYARLKGVLANSDTPENEQVRARQSIELLEGRMLLTKDDIFNVEMNHAGITHALMELKGDMVGPQSAYLLALSMRAKQKMTEFQADYGAVVDHLATQLVENVGEENIFANQPTATLPQAVFTSSLALGGSATIVPPTMIPVPSVDDYRQSLDNNRMGEIIIQTMRTFDQAVSRNFQHAHFEVPLLQLKTVEEMTVTDFVGHHITIENMRQALRQDGQGNEFFIAWLKDEKRVDISRLNGTMNKLLGGVIGMKPAGFENWDYSKIPFTELPPETQEKLLKPMAELDENGISGLAELKEYFEEYLTGMFDSEQAANKQSDFADYYLQRSADYKATRDVLRPYAKNEASQHMTAMSVQFLGLFSMASQQLKQIGINEEDWDEQLDPETVEVLKLAVIAQEKFKELFGGSLVNNDGEILSHLEFEKLLRELPPSLSVEARAFFAPNGDFYKYHQAFLESYSGMPEALREDLGISFNTAGLVEEASFGPTVEGAQFAALVDLKDPVVVAGLREMVVAQAAEARARRGMAVEEAVAGDIRLMVSGPVAVADYIPAPTHA